MIPGTFPVTSGNKTVAPEVTPACSETSTPTASAKKTVCFTRHKLWYAVVVSITGKSCACLWTGSGPNAPTTLAGRTVLLKLPGS